MGTIPIKEDLAQMLADLSQRIDNLETGGKPFTTASSPVSTTITLAAGASQGLDATISWSDSSITQAMLAVPYLQVFVDDDQILSDRYGNDGGNNVDEKDHIVFWFMDQNDHVVNPERARLHIFIENKDSVEHDYIIYVAWTYISASSSSGEGVS